VCKAGAAWEEQVASHCVSQSNALFTNDSVWLFCVLCTYVPINLVLRIYRLVSWHFCLLRIILLGRKHLFSQCKQFKLWAWLHLFLVSRVLFYDRSGKIYMQTATNHRNFTESQKTQPLTTDWHYVALSARDCLLTLFSDVCKIAKWCEFTLKYVLFLIN